MEIQKIFTDTEGYEKLYSVILSEEELTLFSEIQKEFNSKAQKALRKTLDLKKGLGNPQNPFSLAHERKMMATYFPGRRDVVENVERQALRLGRKSNREIINPYRKNIHDKINYRDHAKKVNKSGFFKFKLDPNNLN